MPVRQIGTPRKKDPRSRLAPNYAAAILAVVVAQGLSFVFFRAVPPAPGAFALTAVLWVSLVAGRGPGILTTILNAVALDYFFYPPVFALDTNPTTLAGVGCYVLIAFVVGAATDRTREARVRAEVAREEAETLHQQLRAAVEAGGMTTFTWEVETGEVRQTGRLPSGEVDLRFSSMEERLARVHPEDREAVRAAIDRSLQRGEYRTEYRIQEDGRELHWFLEQGRITYDSGGQPQRLAGVTVDITERETGEASRRLLAAIVESSDDAIIGHTLDGTITTWNRGAERLYGYSAGEAVGRPISFLMPPDADEDMREVLARVGRGEHVNHYETVRIARDGRRLEVSLTVSPIRDREGRIVGASKVARDVTERRRLERELLDRTEQVQTQNEELDAQREELLLQNQELEEQDRFRNEFLAMLAHELRNPLAPIVAATDVMRQGAAKGANLERHIGIIARQSRHLARLVNDLLDVSRITRGKVGIRPEGVDLVDIVEQAVQTCDALVRERRHQLILDLPAEPVRLEADPTRLLQVVCNLINNAAKYTDPGGKIEVSLRVEGGLLPVGPAGGPRGLQEPGEIVESVVIRVRDNGRGVEPRLVPRIFELFVQGERAPDRSEGGLGVGLTLVRSLVELHGGTVDVFSEGLGKGCEFVVRLPTQPSLLARAVERGTVHRPPVGALPRLSAGGSPEGMSSATEQPEGEAIEHDGAAMDACGILLVEDNVDAAATLSELIQIWGYDCRSAGSGPQALELVRSRCPKVVLLDIGLPGMDGFEVARRLRDELHYEGAIIGLSGYGQDEDRRRGREAGFNEHLTKPVDSEILRQLLIHWCRQ